METEGNQATTLDETVMEIDRDKTLDSASGDTAGDTSAAAAAAGGHGDDDMDRSSSCSDSDHSDSDGEEEEEANELRIAALEQTLRDQPLDYESHVQYIQCLRKAGHFDKLRIAREEMNKLFPLSPKLWQDWIHDEILLNGGDDQNFTEIEKLYERAVQDYLSVPLWLDYINYMQEHDQSVSQCLPAGVSKMRDLFEHAVTAVGLHVLEGTKIWENYREFEQAILLTIANENDEEREKQVQQIRGLFHRQLSVPLSNLKSTLRDYKTWENEQGNANDLESELDGIAPNVASNYQKATAMYSARKQYEDQLTGPAEIEAEKLQNFQNYIKFEESSGDPARVQILYERAITEFPVSTDLWLSYTTYLDRTLKVPSILQSVYYRATRNCTWVGELWVRYLVSLERVTASEEDIRLVFERSVECAFPSIKEYLDLYLTRVDGLRRRISLNNELDFQLIRQTFMDGTDSLSPQLSTDDILHLHSYWARLEAQIAKDLVAARAVWESLIKKSGSLLEVWQKYIAMEIEMGHINEARSIYKRCYAKRFLGTGSEDICHSWLRFEREYGSLEDYDLAVKKVTPRLNELNLFKSQQESKSDFKDLKHSVSTKDTNTTTPLLKRKNSQLPNVKTEPPAKKRRENLPKKKENEQKSTQVSKEVERGSKESKDNVESEERKGNFYRDRCTAFVSNLNLEAKEEDLRSFFSDCGGVIAIRLLRDKFTRKSRGFAYVDFSDDAHLQSAVAKNKQKFLGKKVSIAHSDPKQGKKRANTDVSSFKGCGRGPQMKSENREDQNAEGTGKDESRVTGKNTFAAPRSVAKPLGWNKREGKAGETGEQEQLKSNEEFRNLFIKR